MATKHYALIIGRFQTDALHEGHKELLSYRKYNLRGAVIAVGVSPLTPSAHNPLTFNQRELMIYRFYEDVGYPQTEKRACFALPDHRSDDLWAEGLAQRILYSLGDDLLKGDTIVLTPLVGKDSAFATEVSMYDSLVDLLASELGSHGVYLNDPLEINIADCSATKRREEIGKTSTSHLLDRESVIWATQQKFPTAYMCVDAAVFDEYNNILLIQKYKGANWQLPGGFSDPDTSPGPDADPLLHDAMREVFEETSLELSEKRDADKFLGHYRIDDWRYRKEQDKINTSLYLFVMHEVGERPEPFAGDDAFSAQWFSIDNLPKLVDGHKHLISEAIREYRNP